MLVWYDAQLVVVYELLDSIKSTDSELFMCLWAVEFCFVNF